MLRDFGLIFDDNGHHRLYNLLEHKAPDYCRLYKSNMNSISRELIVDCHPLELKNEFVVTFFYVVQLAGSCNQL